MMQNDSGTAIATTIALIVMEVMTNQGLVHTCCSLVLAMVKLRQAYRK